MKHTRPALALTVGLLAAARARSSRVPDHHESRAARYVVAPVVHGARIEGTVAFSGRPPALADLPVPASIARANPACGASAIDPSLMVNGANNGVRGTVVYLADVTRGAAPALTPVGVDQHGCGFEPHVLAVAVGAPVRYANHDPGVLHNLHAYAGLAGDETVFNLATPPGLSVARAFETPGIFRVVCDAGHTWMQLYVHAFEHPYFAVTDADGRYAITDVPAGTYRLRVWHEGWQITGTDANGRPVRSAPIDAERVITVGPGTTARADWSLGPDAHATPR